MKSEEDKGSTFFFTVPLRIDTGIPAAALSPGAEATKPAKSLNLLIAEDDPVITSYSIHYTKLYEIGAAL